MALQWDRVLFFGLQYILKRYLLGAVVTQEMIDEAEELFQQHFSNSPGPVFNRAGWEHILNKHGGKLPVRETGPTNYKLIIGARFGWSCWSWVGCRAAKGSCDG